ncbi:hypothetical protein PIECOFPK_00066 [Mycovorax composti]|uniref:NAD(P)-binding domain-containing protein n=2 Tax=Chitinophagaceae TaxID=563835 RepID=A0ABZ2EFU6_9BACT
MSTVAVIGATGFVGSKVVTELVNRGYTVKAIARDISKLPQHEKIQAISADVYAEDDLIEKLKGADAVISTFNAGWDNPNLYDDFLKGSRIIERSVEKAGIKRLIVVGGAGSLYIDGKQIVDGPDFPAAFKPGALAARDYLNEIKKNTTLDWTFFSPAIEMNPTTAGQRKGSYRTNTENPVFDENGRSIISVEDVAVVLVDELEKGQFIRQRFTAAY